MIKLVEDSRDDLFVSGICFAPIDTFEEWKNGDLYFKENTRQFFGYRQILNAMEQNGEDIVYFDDFCTDNGIFTFESWDSLYTDIGLMTFYKEVEPISGLDEKVMMFGYIGYNC